MERLCAAVLGVLPRVKMLARLLEIEVGKARLAAPARHSSCRLNDSPWMRVLDVLSVRFRWGRPMVRTPKPLSFLRTPGTQTDFFAGS